MPNYKCPVCNQNFTNQTNLTRHRKSVHERPTYKCDTYGKDFTRKDALKRHQKTHVEKAESPKRKAEEETGLRKRAKKETPLVDEPTAGPSVPPTGEGEGECKSALKGGLNTFTYKPRERERRDLTLSLQGKRKYLIKQLANQLKKKKGLKWFLSVKIKFVKTQDSSRR